MSALARAIQRSFVAAEHDEPVISAHRPLGRTRLGPAGIYAQALGTVAPAAAMILFPTMLLRSQQPGVALIIAVAAMLGMCCLGGCLAHLATRISASGGLYSFVTLSIGPRAGLIVIGCLVVKYVGSAALSLYHIAWALDRFARWAGWPPGGSLSAVGVVLGVAILIMVTVLAGVRRVTAALMIIELVSISFLIIMMVWGPSSSALGPIDRPEGHVSYLVVTFVVFAMAGFESATFLGPESRRGPATTGLVTWTTPVVCSVLLLIAGTAALTGHADVVVSAYLHGSAGGVDPLVAAAVEVVLVMSLLGSATASVNALSRAVYALGLEGVISPRWSAVQSRSRTPYRAVVCVATLVAALGAVVTVLADSHPELMAALRGAIRIGLLIMYALAVAAVARLLQRLDEHTPGSIALVVAAAVGATGMLVAVGVGEFSHRPVVIGAVVVGLVLVGPAAVRWAGHHRERRPGVYDRCESGDALPGVAGVGTGRRGELILTGRREGDVAGDGAHRR